MVTQKTIDVVLMYVGICGKSLNVSFSCNSVLLKWLITLVKTVVAKEIFSMSTPTPLSMIVLWWLWRRSFKWDAFCTSWVMMTAGVWHNDGLAINDLTGLYFTLEFYNFKFLILPFFFFFQINWTMSHCLLSSLEFSWCVALKFIHFIFTNKKKLLLYREQSFNRITLSVAYLFLLFIFLFFYVLKRRFSLYIFNFPAVYIYAEWLIVFLFYFTCKLWKIILKFVSYIFWAHLEKI